MSMPERVPSGREPSTTRREILLTAARLFAERGFAGVSVIEVAAAAGVFPNQVTYYFGGKDGLFVEVAGCLILEAGQAAEIEAQKAKSVREIHAHAGGCPCSAPACPRCSPSSKPC